MKAVRLIQPGQLLEMQNIDIPPIGSRDVLVRVRAAGICHSDVHYRAGTSLVGPLPLTLGHEVAGIVEQTGSEVSTVSAGDRVCIHYMVTCGECSYCSSGNEQFCRSGAMIGKHRDGGFAGYISIPARNVFKLPSEIPFEQGAVMMCSSATSLHAIRKARLKPGETAAVFGVGGLGMSAVQLAGVFGALTVFAVDINPVKLELAARLGAVPINAGASDPVREIMDRTAGNGVDVALELVGLPVTFSQAVRSLAIGGRAALVGITDRPFELTPYHELINKEAEIIGVSDHLAQEIPLLIELVSHGKIDVSGVITKTVPLEAGAVNDALDSLERFDSEVRMVVVP